MSNNAFHSELENNFMKKKTFTIRLVKEPGTKGPSPFDYNCPASSAGFCGGEFLREFPHLNGIATVDFTVSTVRQHRKGEHKVELDPRNGDILLERITIDNFVHRLMPATGMHFRRLYGLKKTDAATFYIHANPAKL